MRFPTLHLLEEFERESLCPGWTKRVSKANMLWHLVGMQACVSIMPLRDWKQSGGANRPAQKMIPWDHMLIVRGDEINIVSEPDLGATLADRATNIYDVR